MRRANHVARSALVAAPRGRWSQLSVEHVMLAATEILQVMINAAIHKLAGTDRENFA